MSISSMSWSLLSLEASLIGSIGRDDFSESVKLERKFRTTLKVIPSKKGVCGTGVSHWNLARPFEIELPSEYLIVSVVAIVTLSHCLVDVAISRLRIRNLEFRDTCNEVVLLPGIDKHIRLRKHALGKTNISSAPFPHLYPMH